MAEIHVERKRSIGSWVWVLLLVILLVAAAVWAWQAGYINLGMSTADVQTTVAMTINAGGPYGT